jgi:hypothetical protein
MTKKKMWDNTNMQEEIQWGNIELPGMPDEILLSKNWNRVDGSKNMWVKMSDEQKSQRSTNISEKKKQNHPMKGKSLPEEWKKNVSEQLKGKTKPLRSEEHRSKFRKPLMSENGPFASVADAQKHFGYKWEGNVRHKIKKGHPGWYWLSQEEYDQLIKNSND